MGRNSSRHEAKLVQKIVEEISLELRCINWGVDENLIGMKTRIDGVVSSLELGVDDVRMIGIKGMGGAGKTTLARAIYEHISYQFEGYSFVENVREKSTPSMSGLNLLQKQVLSDVLLDQGINVSGVLEGKSMLKKKMCRRKVLIVLDDVDKIEQLMALAGDHSWFKPGSRIIITTRDAQVLIAHKVNLVRDVHLLDDKEAIRLFSRHAFGREIPVEGYKELSEQVVRYAAGLPLTIKVLGSFLCGKDDIDWKDALERLETIPLNETMNVLELSYIDLEEDYKEIFLDVACILKGWRKDDAIRVLESFGFHARIGLRVLELKSLITISEVGTLEMHDHIQEMGDNIVRRVNLNKPEMHSRLWITEEIVDILANNKGTQATKCIKLDAREINCGILMNGLANMKELRFLYVVSPYVMNFYEDSLHLPNALRFLKWDRYPFSSLPKDGEEKSCLKRFLNIYAFSSLLKTFQAKKAEEKACLKLRFLEFTWSNRLKTLDLSVAPNLETLILEGCDNLVEVHFQVTPNLKELCISHCNRLEKLHMPESPKLRSLDLSYLEKLRTIHLGVTPNLKTVSLKDFHDLVELQIPAECPKLVTLDFCNLWKLRTLHLGVTPNLETLRVSDCDDLVELQIPAECPKLVNLNLSTLKLRTLDLRVTPNLETLTLSGCADSVELIPAECPKLVNLHLSGLKLRTLDLSVAPNHETLIVHTLILAVCPNLNKLHIFSCYRLEKLHMPAESPKLRSLDLSDLEKLRTLHLGVTPNLETLTVSANLVELQIPAECPKLRSLDLSHLENLRTLHLGVTPNLETLTVSRCADLVELQIPAECPKLRSLDLSHLEKLRTLHLGVTPNLETLKVSVCANLVELQIPAECPKLRSLHLSWLRKLRTLHLGVTPNLETLRVKKCHDLVELQIPAECPKLVNLDLSNCIQVAELHEEIGRLECLKELDITRTGISRLPESIFRMKGLRIVGSRWLLESCGFTSEIKTSDDQTFCYI